VTTLIIPGENDSLEELNEIAGFIKNELGKETPWHISRFYPQFKFDNHYPTPAATLQKAHDIGKKNGLRYVYMGNVPGNQTESTFCHNCNEVIIDRYGYQIFDNNIESGKCKFCGVEIDGVKM